MSPLLQDYRYFDVMSAVFKISDACNLACRYCYRDNAEEHHGQSHMPIEIVNQTLGSVLSYKRWLYARYGVGKRPSLHFVWHGGEPLIVGKKRVEEILLLQQRYRADGLDISNSIQTNGTLIDESFIDMFSKEQFQVGISVDGPKEINDKHRIYRRGTSSFDRVERGIGLLKEHAFPWSAIAVISRENANEVEAIFDYFKSAGPVQVDFIPAFFYDTDISLPPEAYANFMIRMFDLWTNQENPPFMVRFFKDVLYLLGLWNGRKGTIICELAGQCHRNISLMTNGDVYSCECLNAKVANKIGNIRDQTLLEILCSKPFIRISQSTNAYRSECLDCDVFHICKAGCYNRRLPLADGSPQLDFYCEARRAIIRHIRKDMLKWTPDLGPGS